MAVTTCRLARRWLVLSGSFIAVFLAIGTLKSFGLFINDMSRDLQTTIAMLGLAFGLFHGLSDILAIINIPLMKKFSARRLMMTGALVGCLGLISSAFSKSGAHFVWAMGISGAGFSIVFFPCHTCCTLDYFPDAFEKAVSVMLTGGGLGMMLLPLLVKQLHDAYGWRGAIIILGALNLNFIVVGALMKPVKKQMKTGEVIEDVVECTASKKGYVEVKQDTGDHGDVSSVIAEGRQSISEIPAENVELGECSKLTDEKWTDEADLGSETQKDRGKSKSKEILDREKWTVTCDKPSGSGEGTIIQVRHDIPINEIIDHEESIDTCDEYVTSKETGAITQSGEDSASHTGSSRYEFLKNLFDLGLFIKNPTFIFPLLVYFLFGITFTCWIVFVIPNAVAKGYTTGEGAFLATTGGAANIAGRFAIGFISSRDFIRDEISCCLIFLTSGAAFFCNTFASSFWSLVILSLMNGFSSGANTVMASLLAKKTLPLDVVSTGMCYLFLSQGIGKPVGGAIVGNFYDQTKSYVLAFNVAASLEFLSAMLILFPLFLRWCKSKTRRSNSNNLGGSENERETVM